MKPKTKDAVWVGGSLVLVGGIYVWYRRKQTAIASASNNANTPSGSFPQVYSLSGGNDNGWSNVYNNPNISSGASNPIAPAGGQTRTFPGFQNAGSPAVASNPASAHQGEAIF